MIYILTYMQMEISILIHHDCLPKAMWLAVRLVSTNYHISRCNT